MDINQAEKAIAAILKQLEVDQGVLVEGLSLDTIDSTTHDDDRRQFYQHVVIELRRLPGNNWGQV